MFKPAVTVVYTKIMIQKMNIPIYELLTGLFVTTLIVSNIASIKMVAIGPMIFDAGTILFPLAYILGDIITEVYGFRKMRTMLYVGIAMLLLASLTFWMVGLLPSTPDWLYHTAYQTVLGVTLRIVFASVSAILVGELINGYVLVWLKKKTEGRQLWVRLIGSSALGSFIDTTLFTTLAFAGTIPSRTLLTIIATVFGIKMATEILVSPLTMQIIGYIKRKESLQRS